MDWDGTWACRCSCRRRRLAIACWCGSSSAAANTRAPSSNRCWLPVPDGVTRRVRCSSVAVDATCSTSTRRPSSSGRVAPRSRPSSDCPASPTYRAPKWSRAHPGATGGGRSCKSIAPSCHRASDSSPAARTMWWTSSAVRCWCPPSTPPSRRSGASPRAPPCAGWTWWRAMPVSCRPRPPSPGCRRAKCRSRCAASASPSTRARSFKDIASCSACWSIVRSATGAVKRRSTSTPASACFRSPWRLATAGSRQSKATVARCAICASTRGAITASWRSSAAPSTRGSDLCRPRPTACWSIRRALVWHCPWCGCSPTGGPVA
jgi:hypothetical protein